MDVLDTRCPRLKPQTFRAWGLLAPTTLHWAVIRFGVESWGQAPVSQFLVVGLGIPCSPLQDTSRELHLFDEPVRESDQGDTVPRVLKNDQTCLKSLPRSSEAEVMLLVFIFDSELSFAVGDDSSPLDSIFAMSLRNEHSWLLHGQ